MMVTITIDRKLYTVGPQTTVGELYRRAGINYATHKIRVDGSGSLPDQLDLPLRFTGKGGCAFRVFVSAPR